MRQIRHAYGFDQIEGNGTGQTIAIVDAYNDPGCQRLGGIRRQVRTARHDDGQCGVVFYEG